MSGFKVNFSVNNQLATPAIHAAALVNRPAAGQPGRVFIDTDNPSTGIYRDTGTAWIQIAATSSPETDTLQTVTNRGNTTTQNVTIGAGTIPVGTIDARKATAALNNSSDRAIIAQSTPTIPNGASFGVHNVSVVEGGLIQDYQGSATIANTGTNAAGIFVNSITFSSATPQTLTVSQSSGIRAIAGTQTGLYFTGSGAGGGTITHVAGLRVVTPINTGGTAINITNNYGLLVSTQTPLTGTINYTNRYGIYQEGASDVNYFAANSLFGTLTNSSFRVDIAGTSRIVASSSSAVLTVTQNQGWTGTQYTIDANGYSNFGGIRISGSETARAIMPISSTAEIGIATSGNRAILFTQSGTDERMRIAQGGNVLIGTTTDGGQKLQIEGGAGIAVRVANSGTNAGINISNSTYPYIVFNRAGTVVKSFGIFNATGDMAIQESTGWSGANSHIFYGGGGFSTIGSGNFGNNVAANASAILQATSTTKGFLPPTMTNAQMTSIVSPATGLMVYDTTNSRLNVYDGSNWISLH